MTSGPILRAQPENGRTWDDPSEDLLFTLLEDIESGEGTFLVVTRTADASGQTYAQALRRDDGSYLVEHREGGPDAHFGTVVADVRAAHALLAGWAFEKDGWSDSATWTPVDV